MGTVVAGVVAAGVAAVVALTLVVAAVGFGARAWSRWRGGLRADGVVVAAGPAGPSPHCHPVTAQFRTPDGQQHRVVVTAPRPLPVGTPVSLRYPAGDPQGAVLAPSAR